MCPRRVSVMDVDCDPSRCVCQHILGNGQGAGAIVRSTDGRIGISYAAVPSTLQVGATVTAEWDLGASGGRVLVALGLGAPSWATALAVGAVDRDCRGTCRS